MVTTTEQTATGRDGKRFRTMTAVVHDVYGPPEVLELRQVPLPTPGPGQVMVRVLFSSVNPYDWHYMNGRPYVARLFGEKSGFGLRRPIKTRSGWDVSGVITAVGPGVDRLRVGDEVFGWQDGAFAEYVTADESHFVPKPAQTGFDGAAATPLAALTALQALRDHGEVGPGQRVLINAGSGGVGTFAVQLARWMGADVTAVTSTRNVEMVRELGAHRVIDYTKEDFTLTDDRYDVIIDSAVSRSLRESRRALTRDGIHVIFGDTGGRWLGGFARVLQAAALGPFVSQRMRSFTMEPTLEDLELLSSLLASGAVRPVIDRAYPLDEIGDAVAYVLDGHARAKVVVSVARPGSEV